MSDWDKWDQVEDDVMNERPVKQCGCRTVKFYDEHQEHRCMICYRKFAPLDETPRRGSHGTG